VKRIDKREEEEEKSRMDDKILKVSASLVVAKPRQRKRGGEV